VEDADRARHAVSSRFDGNSHEGRKWGIAEARMPNIDNRQYLQGAAKCSKPAGLPYNRMQFGSARFWSPVLPET
jgi:hypothetical protein